MMLSNEQIALSKRDMMSRWDSAAAMIGRVLHRFQIEQNHDGYIRAFAHYRKAIDTKERFRQEESVAWRLSR